VCTYKEKRGRKTGHDHEKTRFARCTGGGEDCTKNVVIYAKGQLIGLMKSYNCCERKKLGVPRNRKERVVKGGDARVRTSEPGGQEEEVQGSP
jgi:hypothetical protein